MRARRTPWWSFVLAAALGVLAGMGLAKYGEISGLPLVGAPWIVPVVLAVLGGVVLYMALQIHKYTTKDPVKRAQLKPLDPQKAFGTLVACKALGLAGAALAGWYGGQIIMSLPHGEAEFYSQAIIECVVACVVCVADMIVGIVGEWLCRIPPIDGPESPAVKKAAQRNRYAAAAHEGVYKIGCESCHEIESLNVRPSLTLSQSFFGTRNIASCAMRPPARHPVCRPSLGPSRVRAPRSACLARTDATGDVDVAVPPHRMVDGRIRNARRGDA